jgi:RimJ/RimL family protein N-acetyltransferase
MGRCWRRSPEWRRDIRDTVTIDPVLQTERLILRRWTRNDAVAFHALNSDPLVMATIGAVMSRGESDKFMDRIEHGFDEHGFGLWCVEFEGEAIGFTGLGRPWFRDGIEIGWRIRAGFWGRGLAPEAARECLRFGFDELELDEVISFTATTNKNSLRVMEKIGLKRDLEGDFDHPSIPVGNPLREHVLYRLSRANYRATS